MRSAVIFLDVDSKPARLAEFFKVARDEHQALDCIAAPYPAHTGRTLIELAGRVAEDLQGGPPVEHLALIMHGSTTGILRPGSGQGLHVSASRHPGLYTVDEFARSWAPVLADGALISLCACLCARSPAWYLREAFGSIPSSWGPVSYKAGGRRSFAGRMRDAFTKRGKSVRVRAHTVVGHVTYSPMLREFGPELGGDGVPLFELALPGIAPTLANRRRWVRLVRGQLARDWIMGVGDERVIERIRVAWPYEGSGGAVS
uniref:Uncharacterized protein n=1 Tax=viral metagenome TaxID=1070528 RepID=A0A6M3LNH3_9ZZZZ